MTRSASSAPRSASSALGRRPWLLAMTAIVFAVATPIQAAADQKPAAPGQNDTHARQHEPSQPRELRLHFRLPDGITWPAGLLPEIYPEGSREKGSLILAADESSQ